jgi:hypothetical protein
MRVLLCLALGFGALMGVPIDPEKIREILALSSRDEQAETMREQGGEDIEEYLNRRGLRSDGDESPDARTERSPSLLTPDF